MKKVHVLLRETLDISDRFRVELEVLVVTPSKGYPDGVKVSFVLIDVELRVPRLIIDNHAPLGFHAHLELPNKKEVRQRLPSRNYLEALGTFFELVEEILVREN